MSDTSARRRWRLRAIRHLTIQSTALVIFLGIAVVFAIGGHWTEAGVFALLAVFPAVVLAALIHKIRRFRSLQRRSWTKYKSV